MGKLHVNRADAEVRQDGAIKIVLDELGYTLVNKTKITVRSGTGTTACRVKHEYHVKRGDSIIFSFMTNGTRRLEAKAHSRDTYAQVHEIFTRLADFEQDCNIKKEFVEVCDFKPKLSLKSKILKKFSKK